MKDETVVKGEETEEPAQSASAASGCDTAPEAAESRLELDNDDIRKYIDQGNEDEVEAIGEVVNAQIDKLTQCCRDISVAKGLDAVRELWQGPSRRTTEVTC